MICEPEHAATRSTKGGRGLLAPRGRSPSKILDARTVGPVLKPKPIGHPVCARHADEKMVRSRAAVPILSGLAHPRLIHPTVGSDSGPGIPNACVSCPFQGEGGYKVGKGVLDKQFDLDTWIETSARQPFKIRCDGPVLELGMRPRLLDCAVAAAYVGLSVPAFLKAVAGGHYPPPLRHGTRRLWTYGRSISQSIGVLASPLSRPVATRS